MNINLKFGHEEIKIEIDNNTNIDFITPPPIDINTIWENKISFEPLYEVIRNKNVDANQITVGIAINDKTRPVPYPLLIPPLFDELLQCNIRPENIKIFISNGTHVPDNNLKYLELPNQLLSQYKFLQHNAHETDNLVFLGFTSFNTPIILNESYYECDLKISVGNIEPHHFAGYSGGAKTVAIGLAGFETINHNHSLLLDPNSVSCEYTNNKVRQDIEEIGEVSGLDLSLNCVQTVNHEILRIYFDKPKIVMQQAIPFVNELFTTKVSSKYDLVIASAGGYPKDINFYQSQKAYSNAHRLLRENGKLILLAECSEGIGSEKYYDYIKKFGNPEDVIKDFLNNPFEIGKHKAFLMAKIQLKNDVYLYSKMNSTTVSNCLITPINDINYFFSKQIPINDKFRIAIMPNAVTTIPMVKEKNE